MKRLFMVFLFLIYSELIYSKPILVGSYNTMRLGQNEKDLSAVAKIISKFDIVALQEVMNREGLDRLKNEIEKKTGEKWGYVISEKPVGSKEYKEYYSFIYKKGSIDKIESLGLYQDGKSKDFIREPYAVYVKSNNFDFVLITAHSIFGDSKSEREIEASRYHKVYKYFKDKTHEEDIILLGDFNLPANSHAFKYFKDEYKVKEVLNPNVDKTTISESRLANSYDNIFFNRSKLREWTKRYGVYDYTKDNYKEIRKYVSDHLLIFIEFENGKDLDD